jgi:hypothetical protein
MNESGAEARLVVELIAVQPDERPAELDRQIRAECGIENGNDEEFGTDRPEDSGKGEDREGAIHRHEHEGKRRGRKRAHVLGNPLIRVCELTRYRQAIVGSVGQIRGDAALGHEFAPKQAESLLGEARQNCDDRGSREDRERELRLPNEFPDVPLLDGGHQVPVDVTVRDVEAVPGEQECYDCRKHEFRSPADLRLREVSDGRDKSRRESGGGRSLGWHASPGQIVGRIESQSGRSQKEGDQSLTGTGAGETAREELAFQ